MAQARMRAAGHAPKEPFDGAWATLRFVGQRDSKPGSLSGQGLPLTGGGNLHLHMFSTAIPWMAFLLSCTRPTLSADIRSSFPLATMSKAGQQPPTGTESYSLEELDMLIRGSLKENYVAIDALRIVPQEPASAFGALVNSILYSSQTPDSLQDLGAEEIKQCSSLLQATQAHLYVAEVKSK